MKRDAILDEAKRLTMGERENTYGGPVESYTAVVTAFNVLTGHKLRPDQGVLFMQLLKAHRHEQSPTHIDTIHDETAYSAIKGEVALATLPKREQ